MSRDNFKKWVCKAIEMEEKGLDFYGKAAEKCAEGPGKEVFIMLRDDELRHIERIKEIEQALDSGAGLEQACVFDQDTIQPGELFRRIAAQTEASKPCASTIEAINTGIDFELALVDFYEQALKDAGEDMEKEFLRRMVAEEKGHYVLLSDLNYYYEDPEGWAMEQDRAGLDGA